MAKIPKSGKSPKAPAAGTVNAQDIVARFREYSPLLDGEDAQEFADFQLSCINAIQPRNAIEEVWVMDFANYTWEAMRLRRLKVALIHSNQQEAVKRLLEDHGEDFVRAAVTAEKWSEGEEEAKAYVAQFIETHGLGEAAIAAVALNRILKEFERLDKLIASYDYRRDKAIRELEQRRDVLARRARDFTNHVTDAEYVELPRRPEH